MKLLQPLQTDKGTAYIDTAWLVLIGPPVARQGSAEARMVSLGGGAYVYVLNTPANLRALGLEDEARAVESRKPTRRTRKATAK